VSFRAHDRLLLKGRLDLKEFSVIDLADGTKQVCSRRTKKKGGEEE